MYLKVKKKTLFHSFVEISRGEFRKRDLCGSSLEKLNYSGDQNLLGMMNQRKSYIVKNSSM